jgi:hypothetical protein
VIRDPGYAVLQVWRQIIARGACFLSRWRNDLGLFDPQTRGFAHEMQNSVHKEFSSPRGREYKALP